MAMVTIGEWSYGDQADGTVDGFWVMEAGIIRDSGDVSLLATETPLPVADWELVVDGMERATRTGLALIVVVGRGVDPPDEWVGQFPASSVVAWVTHNERGGWDREIGAGGNSTPVEQVVILDTGETRELGATVRPPSPELNASAWAAIAGGVGPVLDRMHRQTFLLIGCGRAGTRLAETLASTGVWDLTLVDNDDMEDRNWNGPIGTVVREPKPKVHVVGDWVQGRFDGMRIRPVCASATQRAMVAALTRRSILATCVDSEEVRLVSACYAATYGLPHVDVGIGVLEEGGTVVRGGQVVFVPPGSGCLVCVRGLRWDEVERSLVGDASTQLQARKNGDRRDDNGGSVPDLLARATGTAVGLVRRWLAGEDEGPRRLLLHDNGPVEELPPAWPNEHCPVCAIGAYGEAFLQGVFPPALVHAPPVTPVRDAESTAIVAMEDAGRLGEALALTGAATLELLQRSTQTRHLDELVLRLASEGVSLSWPAPLGPVLEERLGTPPLGTLHLAAANETAEVWRSDRTWHGRPVRFRPERRWAALARLVQEQLQDS